MKLNLKITAALMILCVACSNVKETPKGLAYTLIKKGDGVQGKAGEFLVVSVLLKDAKDSVYFDNRNMDFAEPIRIPDTTGIKSEEGVSEIFRYLTKGDSVKVNVSALDLYTKNMRQPLPPKVDAKSLFTFTFGVSDIITAEQYGKKRAEVGEKQRAKFVKQQAIQLGKDTVTIDSLLAVKKIVALKTKSGIRYTVDKKGTGASAGTGKKVKIEYAGYLINGTCFDTNIEKIGKPNNINRPSYVPWELEAGAGRVMPGFDESIMLMKKGEVITSYIPSTLMYGPQKVNEKIGANSIMIFNIDLLDVMNAPVVKK